MSGSKRQRDLARAKYERQQARRSANADKRRRNQRIVAIVVVGVLVASALAWVFIGRSLNVRRHRPPSRHPPAATPGGVRIGRPPAPSAEASAGALGGARRRP